MNKRKIATLLLELKEDHENLKQRVKKLEADNKALKALSRTARWDELKSWICKLQ